MNKIIYIVCGIFIMCLVIENTNFIYAENEENKLIEDNVIEDNKLIFGEDLDNFVNEYQSEELIENEESNSINEIITENDVDGLVEIEKNQTFEISQATQTIDTSNYGIIRIKDSNNTGKGITMLDRNLGATATGAGITDDASSYGFYFQWGNNYGFPSDPNATIISGNTQVDASEYGPNTENGYYSSDVFIRGNNDWSTVPNNNLWGGSGDSRDGNNRGYPVTNPDDRRGPCPENYHVPSIGEWSKLLEFWADEYTGDLILSQNQNGLNYFSNNSNAVTSFYQRFHISLAGQYDIGGSLVRQNDWIFFWSSSPNGSVDAFRLYGYSTNLSVNYINHRAYAFPIRCFYNSYRLPVIITYDAKGGYWDDDENIQQKVITYTKDNDDSPYSGDTLLGSVKRSNNCGIYEDKKCMFAGWYTLTGDKLRTGNITDDITLYAKWLEFDDIDISYSGVNFTIMDRNLGAENSGTGESAYGYYLTRGEDDIICPEGYHIPSSGEWLGIRILLNSGFIGDFVKDLLNLPFAGIIENSVINEVGENGYYLARNGDEILYAKISDSDIEIQDLNEGEEVSARCFKDYNTGTIKFDSNGGNKINDITAVSWREDGEDLVTPTREHSIFLGWYSTLDFQEGSRLEKNINYKNEKEINLYAKWECAEGYQENGNICEKIAKPSGGSSGGGGSKNTNVSSGTNVNEFEGDSQDSSTDESVSEGQNSSAPHNEDGIEWPQGYNNNSINNEGNEGNIMGEFSHEFIDAYNFAYKNGITTKSSIYNAKMYSPLSRIQMAKMLSNYAVNVLGITPDVSKGLVKFSDVSDKLNKEYENAVTLAYQLGIMGQNIKNKKFRPHDEVTRAEFATALSRLLYGTNDGTGNQKYYEPHITKLYDEGIITKPNPTIKEKRGYVILMLMRSFKYN